VFIANYLLDLATQTSMTMAGSLIGATCILIATMAKEYRSQARPRLSKAMTICLILQMGWSMSETLHFYSWQGKLIMCSYFFPLTRNLCSLKPQQNDNEYLCFLMSTCQGPHTILEIWCTPFLILSTTFKVHIHTRSAF
jgi:hypothetical protein